MTFAESNSAFTTLSQGGASALAIAFLHETFSLMFPFLIAAAVLIVADLYFGIGAAVKRGEHVRLSRAIRRTVNKAFEYVCWVIVSATLAVAFKVDALNWIILAVVVGNELISIITNWLCIRGKKVSGLSDAYVKWIGDKAGIDTSNVKVEDIKDNK